MTLRRLSWGLAGLIAAALLAALGYGLSHPARTSTASSSLIGSRAPGLTVRLLDGRTIQTSKLRGRPLVLNFWASWCSGCRQEQPALDRQARAGVGGVQFLGIDIQDSLAAAKTYETQVKDPYPVGTVVAGDLSAYRVEGPPQTFFIDSEGRIVAHFIGPLSSATLALYERGLS